MGWAAGQRRVIFSRGKIQACSPISDLQISPRRAGSEDVNCEFWHSTSVGSRRRVVSQSELLHGMPALQLAYRIQLYLLVFIRLSAFGEARSPSRRKDAAHRSTQTVCRKQTTLRTVKQ